MKTPRTRNSASNRRSRNTDGRKTRGDQRIPIAALERSLDETALRQRARAHIFGGSRILKADDRPDVDVALVSEKQLNVQSYTEKRRQYIMALEQVFGDQLTTEEPYVILFKGKPSEVKLHIFSGSADQFTSMMINSVDTWLRDPIPGEAANEPEGKNLSLLNIGLATLRYTKPCSRIMG